MSGDSLELFPTGGIDILVHGLFRDFHCKIVFGNSVESPVLYYRRFICIADNGIQLETLTESIVADVADIAGKYNPFNVMT